MLDSPDSNLISKPAVTVIVPAYNVAEYITDTLASLEAQTLTDIEVLVIDNGSTDATPQIVDSFATKDSRFRRVLSTEVKGAWAARNVGLSLAKGDYIAFLDGDDLYLPTALQDLYTIGVADNADIVLTGFQKYDTATGMATPVPYGLRTDLMPRQHPFSARAAAKYLFSITNPSVWNKLWSASYIRAINLEFPPLAQAEDTYFTYLGLAQAHTISVLDKNPVLYRQRAQSLTNTISATTLDFVTAVDDLAAALRELGCFDLYSDSFRILVADSVLSWLNRAADSALFDDIYLKGQNLLRRYGVEASAYWIYASQESRVRGVLNLSPRQWRFENRRNQLANLDTLQPTGAPSNSLAEQFSATSVDVSIIIPVFNSAPWLAECLASALSQTGVNIEVICVDDGSTDKSPVILAAYAAADSRVKVFHQENSGQSIARNYAITKATGRYVLFLDSDDYYLADALAILVTQADAEQLDALFFDAVPFVDNKAFARQLPNRISYYQRSGTYPPVMSGPELLAAFRDNNSYLASPCLELIRLNFLKDNELAFYPQIVHEDFLFTFTMLVTAQRAGYLPIKLYGRRIREDSTTTSELSLKHLKGYWICYLELSKLLLEATLPPSVIPQTVDIVQEAWWHCRKIYAALPESELSQLRQFDTSAYAMNALRMLEWDSNHLKQPKHHRHSASDNPNRHHHGFGNKPKRQLPPVRSFADLKYRLYLVAKRFGYDSGPNKPSIRSFSDLKYRVYLVAKRFGYPR